MVFGLGSSGGGKRGGGQGSQDQGKGKGKRAASKSASPPQQTQRRQTTGAKTSSTQQPQQADARMAIGALVSAQAQHPHAGIVLPAGSSSAKRAKLLTTGKREKLPPANEDDLVWYCCECLCGRRESPPEYNHNSLELCWWLSSKANHIYGPLEKLGKPKQHYCGHAPCSGCIVQKKSAPAPIWVLMYNVSLKSAIWMDGPWLGGYAAFRPYERPPANSEEAITPPWWCCVCVLRSTKNCLKVNKAHMCKTSRCNHTPCKDCWEYEPPKAGVKKPKQRQSPQPVQVQQQSQYQVAREPQYQQRLPQFTSVNQQQQQPPRQQTPQQSNRDRRSKSRSTSKSPEAGNIR